MSTTTHMSSSDLHPLVNEAELREDLSKWFESAVTADLSVMRECLCFAMQNCLLMPNQAFKSAPIITSVARSFSSNGKLFHTIAWPPPPAMVLRGQSKPNIDSLTIMTMLPHNTTLWSCCAMTTPPVLLCSPPFPGPTFPSRPSPSLLYYT